MPRREWRFFVEDILGAIRRVERHCDGATFETFSSDEMVVDAVA